MIWALVAALAVATQLQPGRSAPIERLELHDPDLGIIRYAISVPLATRPSAPTPLVLALHPGGPRTIYFGERFLRALIEPALSVRKWMLVAPDCPGDTWSDAKSERAVILLLKEVVRQQAIDRKRVVVIGYSLGGYGAWFLSARYPELFAAAVPIASWTRGIPDEDEDLAQVPTYVIHSENDRIAPLGPVVDVIGRLRQLSRPVESEVLAKPGHHETAAYIDAVGRAVEWISGRWDATDRDGRSRQR